MAEWPSKEFWNERYREGQTPWDYGRVPAEFEAFLQHQSEPLRILIPGCGSGYEIEGAARHGNDVVAIDLSEEAVARARRRSGLEAGRIIAGDFFDHPFDEGSFDLVYERTFLCALPPESRQNYVARIRSLLKPKGLLAGFFIYGEEPEPPPYPLGEGEEKELFEPFFELRESHQSQEPLPLFTGRERWQIWQKR